MDRDRDRREEELAREVERRRSELEGIEQLAVINYQVPPVIDLVYCLRIANES